MSREAAELGAFRPAGLHLTWLAGATVAVVLPHLARVPWWLGAGFVALAAWAAAAGLGRAPRPWRAIQLALSAAAPLAVLAHYGTLLGRDAGVALLVILAACKLLEVRSLRDAYTTAFLACGLIVANFLFSQDIFTGLYLLAALAVVIGCLCALNDAAHARSARRALRLAGLLLLQAAPLAVVLFVLFPRLPGPLWSLPGDARAGITKLSESMSPGRISELSQSDEIAFRVRFHGAPPAGEDLYWRGPVLWRSDGLVWSGLPRGSLAGGARLQPLGPPTDYTVTLEPHFEHWLLALDMPATIPPRARLSADFQLRAQQPVHQLRKYRVRSYTAYATSPERPEALAQALELPFGFHPRTRELGLRWRAELGPGLEPAAATAALVERSLAFFREQGFRYTLRPPVLDHDPVDEFMFLTRRGFCEFYAAAFTVLMRSAGVPARVVTGYQGGEFNPVGDYLIVRQRDAHAWAEVWSPGHGWVRVDPTAAVAPDRIELGIDAALPAAGGTGRLVSALGLAGGGSLERALRTLRHSWDSIDNAWNQWVVDYGAGRQRRFLDRFGIDVTHWPTLALALATGSAGALALALIALQRRRRPRDRARRLYDTFCRRLQRRGLTRDPHEAPRDFAGRVHDRFPELGAAVATITAAYLDARYADDAPAMDRLAAEVGRFRP